ncbi:MAG: hypothetical protein IAE77_22590 [Prosthecobacter sp.]|jgi:hypothetical protein|uniref:hypothetical protein n=1 Tax=Prosthecobacter sp. TaxID=1965333 RepID=UPI001A0A5869|nr:hypothetical protein [Prosthecobacter sp.]MBE2286261.1 hypothetical protein [Prosthecobacter sp.]
MDTNTPPLDGAAPRGSSKRLCKPSKRAAKTKTASPCDDGLPSADILAQLTEPMREQVVRAYCDRMAAKSANEAARLAIEKMAAESQAQTERSNSAREDQKSTSDTQQDIKRSDTQNSINWMNATVAKHVCYSDMILRGVIVLLCFVILLLCLVVIGGAAMSKDSWMALFEFLHSFSPEQIRYLYWLFLPPALVIAPLLFRFGIKSLRTKTSANRDVGNESSLPAPKGWLHILRQALNLW